MPKLPHIHKVLVIGSGPIVIGQAAEFDYAGAQACLSLKEEGVQVILVNNNPATIMTDEQLADKVYLEPLTLESVTEIIAKERPDGLLPTLGGQTGLNLAVALSEAGVLQKYNVELLGTPLAAIQNGEDRELFKQLMQQIGEPVPESDTVESVEEAIAFANSIGYPVIVRPAYTLGGAGGGIAADEPSLRKVAAGGIAASPIGQVLIERSVKGWKEIEYEVMRDANDTCIIVQYGESGPGRDPYRRQHRRSAVPDLDGSAVSDAAQRLHQSNPFLGCRRRLQYPVRSRPIVRSVCTD